MQLGIVGLDESVSLRLHLSDTKQRKTRPEHLGEDWTSVERPVLYYPPDHSPIQLP